MPSYLSAFRVRITSTESLAVLGGMPWYPPQRQGIYGSAQVVPGPFRKCHFLIRSPPLAFTSRFENSVEWRHRIRPQNPRRLTVGRFRKWKKSHRKEIHYICSFRVKCLQDYGVFDVLARLPFTNTYIHSLNKITILWSSSLAQCFGPKVYIIRKWSLLHSLSAISLPEVIFSVILSMSHYSPWPQ